MPLPKETQVKCLITLNTSKKTLCVPRLILRTEEAPSGKQEACPGTHRLYELRPVPVPGMIY